MTLQISYYAAAADAAGATTAELPDAQLTAAELLRQLSSSSDRLARVLPQCTLLVNGVAVSDPRHELPVGARVDVLPPFAGG